MVRNHLRKESRRTIGRWWQCLKGRFDEHALHLRSRFPELDPVRFVAPFVIIDAFSLRLSISAFSIRESW